MGRHSPGVQGEAKRAGDRRNGHRISGRRGRRVLSTPHMIGYMERTCRDTALPLLEPGHDTVGTKVNVSHLAAAPIGACVTFTAGIVAATGRRIEFRVEAWDENEKIGEGTHERAIVNVAKFAAKLAGKKEWDKAPALSISEARGAASMCGIDRAFVRRGMLARPSFARI